MHAEASQAQTSPAQTSPAQTLQGVVAFGEARGSRLIVLHPLEPDLSQAARRPLSVSDAAPDTRTIWIAFAPRHALINSDFLGVVEGEALSRLDVDLFYGDDVSLTAGDELETLRLKPALNPALLAAQDYIGAPVIIRASALHRLGGLDREAGTAVLYDLVLRAMAAGMSIERIPKVLLAYPGVRPTAGAADRRRVLERWLAAKGGLALRPGRISGTFSVHRRFDPYPAVTLVIPTCQSGPDDGARASKGAPARPFIVSLLEDLGRTAWPMDRLRVLVGDDLASDAAYGADRRPFPLRRVLTRRPVGEPFNYAAKMNRLWRAADTEQIVLMNDDLSIRDPGWLEALLTHSVDEDVGGVGARLLYEDDTLQHAGLVGGLFGAFAHAWIGQPALAPTYQDWALVQRDWSAVTGAVFATRRSVLEAVNGFDERFTLEYNDLDLALRMGALGYRIVYTPDAELVHHEKASRGQARPAGSQTARFLARWREVIADDPTYHPGLSRDSFTVRPALSGPQWYRALKAG